MPDLAWVDGATVPLVEARVPLEDRGFLFGDSVYEVVRIYNGCPFMLQEHLERLWQSAAALALSSPFSRAEVSAFAKKLISASGLLDAYLYFQLTRGVAPREHHFPARQKPSLYLYVKEMKPPLAPRDVKAAAVITFPDRRWQECSIKATTLLPNLLARQAAAEQGAVEAILYRPGGIVTEGSRSNVFALIDGCVRTHPATAEILSGITRRVALELLAGEGWPCEEKPFSVEELKAASEAWLTSTGMEVTPLRYIDEKSLGEEAPGPLTRWLMEAYSERVRTACPGGGN